MTVPDEPDPLEQENRKLREQIDMRPKLALTFADGASHTTARLLVFDKFGEEHVEEMVEEERSLLDDPVAAMRSITHTPPSEGEKDRYLKEFGQWLRGNFDDIIRSRLTVSVDLELQNVGRGTATEIAVSLSVPPPFSLVQPSPATIPPPPAQPKWRSMHDILAGSRLLVEERFGSRAIMVVEDRDRRLEVDDSKPRAAVLHLQSLKHTTNHPVRLPIWLPDADAALSKQGVGISYRVHAASPPDITKGVLNVKLDVTQRPLSVFDLERKKRTA
jgi:hypothetical protein